MGDELVSVSAFAGIMGVSAAAVRSWVKAGRVPAIRPTQRTLRIPLKAAMEQLKGQTSPTPAGER